MHENEFDKDIKAALDDIIDTAPKPPKWNQTTSGYAPLRSEEPQSWYRSGRAAFLGAAAVAIVVVGVAGLFGSGLSGTDSDSASTDTTLAQSGRSPAPVALTVENLLGIWVLASYTFEGVEHIVEDPASPGFRTPPWIEIHEDHADGFAGCNSFSSNTAPVIIGENLTLGEIMITAAGCLEPTPEDAFTAGLWSGPDGVTVHLTGLTMTWTTNAVELRFERRERRSTLPSTEWSTSVGPLDCSPDAVLSENLRDAGQTVSDLLFGVPGVVSIDELGEFEWSMGYNAQGTSIATVIAGDVTPRIYHRSTCAAELGLRPDVEPAAVVDMWVNNLGLNQRSQQVWSSRFGEMCALPDQSALGSLAERYVTEDADLSLWVDGALPALDEARETLVAMWTTVCDTELSFQPLPLPVTPPPTGPIDASQCSTIGMVIVDHRPSYTGLPDPVNDTRSLLIEAALACDYEQLVALAHDGGLAAQGQGIFWGAAGSPNSLANYDNDYGSLRKLVLALTTLPLGMYESQDTNEQDVASVVIYEWPKDFNRANDVPLDELWDADVLQRIADLNRWTEEDLYAISTGEREEYLGFRVGIAKDGRWMYALDGD